MFLKIKTDLAKYILNTKEVVDIVYSETESTASIFVSYYCGKTIEVCGKNKNEMGSIFDFIAKALEKECRVVIYQSPLENENKPPKDDGNRTQSGNSQAYTTNMTDLPDIGGSMPNLDKCVLIND